MKLTFGSFYNAIKCHKEAIRIKVPSFNSASSYCSCVLRSSMRYHIFKLVSDREIGYNTAVQSHLLWVQYALFMVRYRALLSRKFQLTDNIACSTPFVSPNQSGVLDT